MADTYAGENRIDSGQRHWHFQFLAGSAFAEQTFQQRCLRTNRAVSVYWPTFVRHPAYKWTAIVLWLAVSTPAQPQPHPWHDPSKHKVQLVTVDEGVQLEVLDWGGSGRPLVLLAGGGNTAHVYDGFAGKLTKYAHVYGITRRGYGASTRPASGYSEQRLAEDVRQVLDSLHLAAPVLAGHSMGGSELAVFACMYPHRAAGLILMDSAIIDPAKDESQLYDELRDKLPDAMVPQKPPTLADDKSIPLFQGWLIQSDGAAFPESEIRATRDGNRRKSAEDPGAAAREQAVRVGLQKLDYRCIHVPVLAFYALPATLDDQTKRYNPRNDEERSAMERKYRGDLDLRWTASAALTASAPDARIVELTGASHYLFISNPAEVLREVRAFLAKLR